MVCPGKFSSEKGLSCPVLLLCGVMAAFFILIAIVGVHRIRLEWSPTAQNAEKLINKKKYAEAFALIEKAEQGQGNKPLLLVEKGKVWFALALERERRSRWSDYGKDEKDWLKSEEADKAEQLFKKAIESGIRNSDAHYNLGLLYMEKGWFSLAETEFLSVLQRDRKHVDARINLGAAYTEMKRFDLAEKELREAYRQAPENPAVAKNLAFLFRYYFNKPDSAITWANRYLNLDPQSDMDIDVVRQELLNMLQRYPEYTPPEPMDWKKEPLFESRIRRR